jgi:hypothetical protein
MVRKTFYGSILIAAAVLLSSFDLPAGWFTAGSHPQFYDMGIDKGTSLDGTAAATIKSTFTKSKKQFQGFGTLMQNCLPHQYHGKRVRMSGFMKTENVIHWAGFWMRVDQKNSNDPLAFDNMEERDIKGNIDWKKYEIVLNVPENATNIAYGALLVGSGQIWFDNIKFEIVDNKVPLTGESRDILKKNDLPVNLDFEKK